MFVLSIRSDKRSCYWFNHRGREYKVEVEELEKKYKDWQKKLHPDLVHSKTPVGVVLMPFLSFIYINECSHERSHFLNSFCGPEREGVCG